MSLLLGIRLFQLSLCLFDMLYNIGKKRTVLNKSLLCFLLVSCFITSSYAQQDSIKEEAIVQQFYEFNHQPLYWFSSEKNRSRATEWLTMIESSDRLGLVSSKAQSDQVRVAILGNNTVDNINKEKRDRQITGIVLNFIKVLQEGTIRFDYDEVRIPRDSVYINQLLKSIPGETVSRMVSRLDCKDPDYMVLKAYLNDSITASDTLKYKKIVLAMNYRRYFSVNHQTEYILANIPATEVSYYKNDFLKIKMRTVVGRKENPTPLIASYITNIVTFPQWNVPHSIAVKEILPKVQKQENYLEQHNYDVVTARGKVIDDSKLKWKNYTEENFPYFFRQSTGPRNALGVIKFNLRNPFSIFLHSTSLQSAFTQKYRFLSHGCIRLAKPLELAQALLADKIDIKKMKSGKKNTKSETIVLPYKIPVFIIYMPVKVVGKKITFLKDEYGLI